jgi:hypothetical protein
LVLLFLWQLHKSEKRGGFTTRISYATEQRKSRTFVRSMLLLSVTLAAAWLTNIPGAVMIYYSVGGLSLLFAIRAAARERSWALAAWRPTLASAAALALGAGLASFYLLPAIYEQKWINVEQVLSPGVRPQDNFLFTTLADPDHNRFNLLVSMVAMAEIVALLFAMINSQRYRMKSARSALADPIAPSVVTVGAKPWTILSVWGGASGFAMFSFSSILWQHLPKFRFVQLPFRWLLCMNAALAVLLAMATKSWIPRLLTCMALLATLIFVGQLTQPPWWDTAADIREMADFMSAGTGYEGTDEYVPVGADSSELNRNLPPISDEAGKPLPSKITLWEAEKRHFSVHAPEPENIVVRLLNYPAWEAIVNGTLIATDKTENTGLMVIPVKAGESDIYLHFRRTNDRRIGTMVSFISLVIFVICWMKPSYILRTQPASGHNDEHAAMTAKSARPPL